jgi:hypothetical protein
VIPRDRFAWSNREHVHNAIGPGARDGIHKCFESIGEFSPADVIRMMADIQEQQFARLGVRFRSLWGRPLQLVDCQNLFCEVSKYARCAHPDVGGLAGRTRIKQKYRTDTRPLSTGFRQSGKLITYYHKGRTRSYEASPSGRSITRRGGWNRAPRAAEGPKTDRAAWKAVA